jgi:ariadne-1
VHYFSRYQEHLVALRALTASALPALRTTRHEALVGDKQLLLLHLNVLEKALLELLNCRRVLVYTYVLGYYLRDNTPEKQLFEHQQSLLEGNTETLAGLAQKLQKDQKCTEPSEELRNSLK